MNDELMRRISDALDAEGGVEADEELRARLEDDAEAAAYARDLEAIDGALRGLGDGIAEPDWDALAERIEARLDADEALEDIGDATAPPALADDAPARAAGAAVDRSGEVEAAARPRAAAAAPARSEAEVVDLAARRRRRTVLATLGGLAAAAAVGLGITVGLGTAPDAEELASAPTAPTTETAVVEEAAEAEPPAEPAPSAARVAETPEGAPEEAGGAWANAAEVAEMAEAEEEEAEAELPAAATAQPMARAQGAARGRADRDVDALGPLAGLSDESARARPTRRRRARRMRGGGGASSGASSGAAPLAPARERASAAPRPAEPSRVDAIRALRRVEDRVRRCMGERREVARVQVTVRGADGRITAVNVTGPFAGTPAEGCIASAVREVRMPTSASPSYRFAHAFRPAPVGGTGSADRAGSAVRSRAARRESRQMLEADEALER